MSIARFLERHPGPRRAVGLVLGLALCALALGATEAHAQNALPDVDVALVLEVRDAPGWLALYGDVLGSSEQAAKSLAVSVAAGTGGRRSLILNHPKFEVSLAKGAAFFKVIAHGKVSAHEALGSLPPFQLAVIDMQAGGVGADAVVSYGLSSVSASLVELYIVRP